MANVKVVYLGPAKDWAGIESESFNATAGATVEGVFALIRERRPRLGEHGAILRFAVNAEIADLTTSVSDGDEVAVLPPVSGGADSDWVSITCDVIDGAAIRNHASGDQASGAIATFEGITRAETHAEHGVLQRLEYEVYGELAARQMRQLVESARRRWNVRRVALVHRVGPVELGEASVMIVVSAGHRGEAFEACGWLINTLKTEVAIWKREVWESGASSWVDPTKPASK